MKKIKGLFSMAIVALPVLLFVAGCGSNEENTNAGGLGCDFKNPMTYILIALIVLALAWFVFSGSRRKKQAQEAQNNLMNAIQLNVYVMTQGGVIGKVVEIKSISATEKHVVLETGGDDERKSYITYDIRAIMTVLRPEQLVARPAPIETAMPTDEEIQKRLDEVYSAKPAEVAADTAEIAPVAETVFETPVAETAPAAVDTAETAKPKAVVKKTPAKKPAAKKTASTAKPKTAKPKVEKPKE